MKTLSTNSLSYLLEKIKATFFQKSESIEVMELGIDNTPTENSDNLITSGAVYTVVGDVEAALALLRGGNAS